MSNLHNLISDDIRRALDEAGYAVVPKVASKDMIAAGIWNMYLQYTGGTVASVFEAMVLAARKDSEKVTA